MGNYFGAIANWVEMQNDHLADVAASGDKSSAREDVLFSIVDLHSLTTTSMLPEKGGTCVPYDQRRFSLPSHCWCRKTSDDNSPSPCFCRITLMTPALLTHVLTYIQLLLPPNNW